MMKVKSSWSSSRSQLGLRLGLALLLLWTILVVMTIILTEQQRAERPHPYDLQLIHMPVPTANGTSDTENQPTEAPIESRELGSVPALPEPLQPPPPDRQLQSPVCMPETIHRSELPDHSPSLFHAKFETIGNLPPPVFVERSHQPLCSAARRTYQTWDYCLPISGTMDPRICKQADRLDLLYHLHTRNSRLRCGASILHLLLVDVYKTLERQTLQPIVVFGTLLGAIRDKSIIPHTNDIDLAIQFETVQDLLPLRQALWSQGYHLFHDLIWRVCIAPTHPLASILYDPHQPRLESCCNTLYLDLYRMQPHESNVDWFMEQTTGARYLPTDTVLPFTTVQINGHAYQTLADPIDFLVHEYGPQYLLPDH